MIGILSDAHGNTPAFEKGIKILRSYGADKFIFLGDAIGYLPSVGVLEVIKRMGDSIVCTLGNHESMLLNSEVDLERDQIYKISLTRKSLSQYHLDMISSWPTYKDMRINNNLILFVHGSPKDHLNGYLYPDSDLSAINSNYDYVFVGHSHYPFLRQEGETAYCNVGSCGLPRDDGRFGSVALFDELAGLVRLLRYSIEGETEQFVSSLNEVHESVLALFKRRRDNFYGTLVN